MSQDASGFRVQGLGFQGLYRGYIGLTLGLYRDNGKENGNYYLGFRGFRVQGLGFRVRGLGFQAITLRRLSGD